MRFETKFDIGQTVWFMLDSKPREVIISCIQIFYVNTNQDMIKYNAKDAVNPKSWLDHIDIPEDNLFGSKSELIEHVFSEEENP